MQPSIQPLLRHCGSCFHYLMDVFVLKILSSLLLFIQIPNSIIARRHGATHWSVMIYEWEQVGIGLMAATIFVVCGARKAAYIIWSHAFNPALCSFWFWMGTNTKCPCCSIMLYYRFDSEAWDSLENSTKVINQEKIWVILSYRQLLFETLLLAVRKKG